MECIDYGQPGPYPIPFETWKVEWVLLLQLSFLLFEDILVSSCPIWLLSGSSRSVGRSDSIAPNTIEIDGKLKEIREGVVRDRLLRISQ